jgi:hypothetical protein
VQKGKELNDFQRNPLDIEILSNLRFGSLEIRDTSVTRVTNNYESNEQLLILFVTRFSRRFLWKSFSSFPFHTRHDCRRGLVAGYPKLASKKAFFNPKFSDINFVCFLAFLMTVGRSRSKATSVPATPEQCQEVAHEEESGGSDVGDQEDENDSLKKKVKDLSVKLNQVISAVAKLTQQTSVPGILQEAAGAQSTPGSVSGDSISSESAVPVYSGVRLALCVGEADINLKQLCAKHQIDTSSRKQKETHNSMHRAVKGGRSANSPTTTSVAQPASDDVAAGADA